jgi:Fe-S oxidoreductase
MAKMKIEHLHHYHAKHGYSIRDKLIAYLPDYAPYAARWPWLLNLRNRWSWLARAGDEWLGFSAKRSLPAWRTDTAWHRLRERQSVDSQSMRDSSLGDVVLFIDTFNAAFEPENVDAAIKVLDACGYRVHVARKPDGETGNLCCGRTFLSVGMVAEAKASMASLLDVLAPYAEKNMPILGLEPSCLFTLKDEALSMQLGKKAEIVASKAMLIDTFLAQEATAGKLEHFKQKLTPAKQTMRVHGHCHQKAFDEAAPTLRLLSLIPNASPSMIESSCCGMAGAFGYDSAHYDTSMAMAELALLPAVRQASEACVVADGTSCRHQIKDGAGREAMHAITCNRDQTAVHIGHASRHARAKPAWARSNLRKNAD